MGRHLRGYPLFRSAVPEVFWHSLTALVILVILAVEFVIAEYVLTLAVKACERVSGHHLPAWFNSLGVTFMAVMLLALTAFFGLMHLKGWQAGTEFTEHEEDDKTLPLPYDKVE